GSTTRRGAQSSNVTAAGQAAVKPSRSFAFWWLGPFGVAGAAESRACADHGETPGHCTPGSERCVGTGAERVRPSTDPSCPDRDGASVGCCAIEPWAVGDGAIGDGAIGDGAVADGAARWAGVLGQGCASTSFQGEPV